MPDAAPPAAFPWTVPASHAGRMLDGLLRERDPSLSWADARALVETGKTFLNGEPCLVTRKRLRAGDTIEIRPNAPRPAARGGSRESAEFVHVDRQLVVVRKPAGMSSVPFEPGERGTLDELVRLTLDRRARSRGGPAQGWIGVVHRLDKNTTGLLVFARTLAAKKHLANQFRAHTVQRQYVALVHGTLQSRTIRSRLVADRGDGLRGSTRLPNAGQEATTHVEALEHFGAATLVACRLETGRTHQIRIHLSEAGHPLLGEDVYVRDHRGGRVPAPRPMLHAQELGFVHPATDEPVLFRDEWPDDFAELVERLREAGPAGLAPAEGRGERRAEAAPSDGRAGGAPGGPRPTRPGGSRSGPAGGRPSAAGGRPRPAGPGAGRGGPGPRARGGAPGGRSAPAPSKRRDERGAAERIRGRDAGAPGERDQGRNGGAPGEGREARNAGARGEGRGAGAPPGASERRDGRGASAARGPAAGGGPGPGRNRPRGR